MTPPSTTPTAKESSKGFWRNLIVWALLALSIAASVFGTIAAVVGTALHNRHGAHQQG